MATSLLQRTTIVAMILASYRWAQGYANLIFHVSHCIYLKMHLTIFSSYVAGYYHISWKTSLKSYKKVPRQNQQAPPTKEGASIKHHRV